MAELQSAGWVTSDGVLAPSHDAAHVKWGGAWRMPTYQELYDLCWNKCDWTWTKQGGVKGYVVRGRGAYASNSIFLPATGYAYGTSHQYAGSYGCYWSSVPRSDSSYGGGSTSVPAAAWAANSATAGSPCALFKGSPNSERDARALFYKAS